MLRVGRCARECSAHRESALYRESLVVQDGKAQTRPSENTFGECEEEVACVDE